MYYMCIFIRFGAILVLYQNYQDRLSNDGGDAVYISRENNKGVESIYGRTLGPHNGNGQPIAASMIGGGSIYSSTQINKGNIGSALSHTGSNNNVSTAGDVQFY